MSPSSSAGSLASDAALSQIPWIAIREVCAGSGEVLLAAPYIKVLALNMILDLLAHDAKLTCVTRWSPQDIAVGASDLECRAATLSRNGLFMLHPTLHAKYYRFDDRILVGSANITGAGLGYIPASNLEILCPPSSEFNALEFESELLEGSHEVSDNEFENWSSIQAIDLPADWPTFSEDRVGNSGWRPRTRDPEHLRLAYAGNSGAIASYDERVLASLDLRDIGVPPWLPPASFDAWVGSYLLSSPFVAAALKLQEAGPSVEWADFAESWGISRADITRAIETAQAWRAAFLS